MKKLSLRPGVSEAAAIDLDANTDGSLLIQASGLPGEVLSNIDATSASDSSPLRIPLPWKDRQQIPNGGQHPWRIDGDYRSTLLLYNPDAQRANSVRVSVYAKGVEWSKQLSVAPLTTVSVSINELVTGQKPDDKGRILPRDAGEGLATWGTLSDPKIFGMLVQADTVSGVLRPYACAESYAVCEVDNDPLTLAVGGSNTTYANALYCGTYGDCSCVESCGSGSASLDTYVWSVSDNSGTASLTSNPLDNYGAYKGNKAGQTYSAVSVTDSMGCPGSGTGPINVVQVQVYNAGTQITQNQTVYISAVPQMPNMQAQLAGAQAGKRSVGPSQSGTSLEMAFPITVITPEVRTEVPCGLFPGQPHL